MTIFENFCSTFVYIIRKLVKFNTKHINFSESLEFTAYIALSITVYNTCLIILLILLLLNMLVSYLFKRFGYTFKFIRYVNFLVLTTLIVLVFIKFYLTLKLENILGVYIYALKLDFYTHNNKLGYLEHFAVVSSSFSDAILLLSLLIGLICLELLSQKNLFKTISNVSLFFLFNLFVITMVSTNNLLIMFVSFEFIFLPTIFFAFTLGYTKKIDTAVEYLILWTLFGSFLVLCNLGYLYYQYNTLNYIFLSQKKFSKLEINFLFINFLIGFGIKIPIAPLHQWLIKVHVEAPTGFSIFLSGFLVKSALYCLYMFINLLNDNNIRIFFLIWAIYSLIISTIGLAKQTDIKKLIAWATVQEMSFIVVFLIFKQIFLLYTCVIFIVLHGLMSAYMFFFIDILQKRYNTRSLQNIKSLNLLFPTLTKYLWFLILLFSGFPLTIKFFIEWSLVSLLLETNKFILLVLLFFVNFLGVIFFCKIMFTILYGSSETTITKVNQELTDAQKKEESFLQLLSLLILLILILVFLI